MPFGLCNAPATYTRVMNLVLRGLTWDVVLAFLDDVLVLGTCFDSHLLNLRSVYDRLRHYQIKLKPRKCELFQRQVVFLGRIIRDGQVEMDEEAVKPIKDWPIPKNTKQVEQFLGLANYHRSFIKDFAKRAVPLYCITGKKQFAWGQEQQSAFEDLIQALC